MIKNSVGSNNPLSKKTLILLKKGMRQMHTFEKQCLCEISNLEDERVGDTNTLELLQDLEYAKQSITQAEHIYIISEYSYTKLINIMDTELIIEDTQ